MSHETMLSHQKLFFRLCRTQNQPNMKDDKTKIEINLSILKECRHLQLSHSTYIPTYIPDLLTFLNISTYHHIQVEK